MDCMYNEITFAFNRNFSLFGVVYFTLVSCFKSHKSKVPETGTCMSTVHLLPTKEYNKKLCSNKLFRFFIP